MHLPVQAVLFDIDGTLVDSTGTIVRTWRAWAKQWGVDADEILRVSHGRRNEDTIALFLPAEQVPAATADLDALELADLDGVVALPGVASLLRDLPRERWAAVTSGPRELMLARLAAAGLPIPSVLVAAEDVRAGKPDPEGYRKAAAELEHDITRCLVVEDAPAGIRAGRAAGARTLAVATSHDPSELTEAETVVPDLATCTLRIDDDGLIWTV